MNTISTKAKVQVAVSSLVLFCCSLLLTAYTAKNPSSRSLGSLVMLSLMSPIHRAGVGFSGSVRDVWGGYLALVGVRADNAKLRERLAVLEAQVASLEEFRLENQRLQGILNFSQTNGLKGVAARVIAYDPSNWVRTVTVDRGSRHGVAVGMAVVERRGVVGQVVAVGLAESRVLLITDHASGLDATIQSSRVRGIVEGAGDRSCRFRFVLAEEDVQIGERIVTSGLDGIYPRGLPVGVISELERSRNGLFQFIEVAPAVDFMKLEELLIVTEVEVQPAAASSRSGVEATKGARR